MDINIAPAIFTSFREQDTVFSWAQHETTFQDNAAESMLGFDCVADDMIGASNVCSLDSPLTMAIGAHQEKFCGHSLGSAHSPSTNVRPSLVEEDAYLQDSTPRNSPPGTPWSVHATAPASGFGNRANTTRGRVHTDAAADTSHDQAAAAVGVAACALHVQDGKAK